MIAAFMAFRYKKALAVLGAILYFIATYVAVYYFGRNGAQAECDSAKLAAELQKSRADVERLQRGAQAYQLEISFLKSTRETFDGRVNKLEEELRDAQGKPPVVIVKPGEPIERVSCPVPSALDRASADDLRRLRRIAPDN